MVWSGAMSFHRFAYVGTEIDDGSTAYRAFLAVSLGNGENTTEYFLALVDTGADYCLFPADLLPTLGLDPSTLVEGVAMGLGGLEKVLFANVMIRTKYLGVWPAYVGFARSLSGHGNVGMLGHRGFFDKFRVTFDTANGFLDIEAPSTKQETDNVQD